MKSKQITVVCPYCESVVNINKTGFDVCPICGNDIERNYKRRAINEAVRTQEAA